jgi:CubicO group peptidase (beta-lactamase class C family)
MRKRLLAIALLAAVVLAASVAVYLRGFGRIAMGLTLFRGAEQVENFSRATRLFPTTTLPKSKVPFRFPQGEPNPLPTTFVYEGTTTDVDEFLAETDTSAVIVLKDGEVRFERYYRTGGPDVHWLSWSVAKSFVSALVGIAVHDVNARPVAQAASRSRSNCMMVLRA